MNPRPLTEREQNLIDLYGYCSLGMTPQQFYTKMVSQSGSDRLYLLSLNVYRPKLVQKRWQLPPSVTCRFTPSRFDGFHISALLGHSLTTLKRAVLS